MKNYKKYTSITKEGTEQQEVSFDKIVIPYIFFEEILNLNNFLKIQNFIQFFHTQLFAWMAYYFF